MKGRNQILSKTNYTVANKDAFPPSKDKHDYMSTSVYAYHAQELKENTKIP
jgi:hypothetical protein